MLHPAGAARLAAAKDGAPATIDVQTVSQPVPRATYNAVGFLPGTDPSSGTILLSAHLDHLGVGRPVAGDSIYNGANDDAAGTTAVLELAYALAAGPRLKRNILFVCYGSEEIGELGSTYFGEHPPVPLTSLVAHVEFEMIGNQDPKTAKGVLLFTGWDRSNLGPTLRAHGALLGPDPYPDQHFFERSDNYALALKGVVAHTAGDPLPLATRLDHIDGNGVRPTLPVGDSVQLNAIGMLTGGLLGLFYYDRLPDAVWTVSDTSMAQLTPVIPGPTDTTAVTSAWGRGKRAGTANVTVSARNVSSTVPLHIVPP